MIFLQKAETQKGNPSEINDIHPPFLRSLQKGGKQMHAHSKINHAFPKGVGGI